MNDNLTRHGTRYKRLCEKRRNLAVLIVNRNVSNFSFDLLVVNELQIRILSYKLLLVTVCNTVCPVPQEPKAPSVPSSVLQLQRYIRNVETRRGKNKYQRIYEDIFQLCTYLIVHIQFGSRIPLRPHSRPPTSARVRARSAVCLSVSPPHLRIVLTSFIPPPVCLSLSPLPFDVGFEVFLFDFHATCAHFGATLINVSQSRLLSSQSPPLKKWRSLHLCMTVARPPSQRRRHFYASKS